MTAIIFLFFNTWKAYLFDEEFAKVLGVKTAIFDYLIFLLIAISIVALIRVVGIILVIALLTVPAATAALFSARLHSRMLLAVLFSIIYTSLGLWLSYELNIASGASIVIVAVLLYLLFSLFMLIKAQFLRKTY